MRLSHAICCSALLAAHCAAQASDRGGMAVFPLGLVLAGNPETLVQGTNPAAQVGVPGPNFVGIDYSRTAVFGSALAGKSWFRLNSMATGNDRFPIVIDAQNDAVLSPADFDSFAALAFTAQAGADDGDHLASVPGGLNGAEVMGYYVEGSMVHQQFITDPYWLEHSAHLGDIGGVSDTDQIVALDLYLGWLVDPSTAPGGMLQVADSFYFTLPNSTRFHLNLATSTSSWVIPVGLSAFETAIFKATWTSGNGWEVAAYRSYYELGLDLNDEIDALAVGELAVPDANDWVVYSLTQEPNSPTYDVFRAHRAPNFVMAGDPFVPFNGVLKLPDDSSIPEGVNLRPSDDIKSFCMLDPERHIAPPTYAYSPPDVVEARPYLTISMCRTAPDPLLSPSMDPQGYAVGVSGWGGQTPEAGIVTFHFALGATPISMPPVSGYSDLIWLLRPASAHTLYHVIPDTGTADVAIYARFATNTAINNGTWVTNHARTPAAVMRF